MGRRMGLARIEALLESVDRDLNLTNSTLTDCTITTSELGSFTGGVLVGATGGYKFTSATATSATIAVTDDTDYAVPAIEQPAGTVIWDVIFIPAGNIVTGGSSGNDLDFEIGTAASGAQLCVLKAILDDGGSAITWTANYPISPFQNGAGRPANYAIGSSVATSEATVWAGTPYSAAARDIHVNFRPGGADLATAATTIKVIMTFLYV
tara:strand:- start:248 stop:874 length:627 start_codon:yes stop_codon:yes gene_type:complete